MDEIILLTIKRMLGISDEDKAFDMELVVFINTALMVIHEVGVGADDFQITPDGEETWHDFIEDNVDLIGVQTFVYLKVRIVFDPPQSSYVLDSMQKQADELLWRLNVASENKHESIEYRSPNLLR